MGKLDNSISITKSSLGVLRKDKELISINFFGGLGVIMVWVIGMLALFLAGGFDFITTTVGATESTELSVNALGYIGLGALALATTFMRFFIEGMIAAAALLRFRGGDPTISSSFASAKAKSWPLLQFAAVSVTIGLIFKAIEERAGMFGAVVGRLLGFVWAIASAFAVINIVDSQESLGPINATKKSAGIIKKTWGDNIVLNLGLGIALFLGFVSYIILSIIAIVAAASVASTLGFIVGGLLIAGLLMLFIAASVLGAIIKAAIYFYAVEGVTPEGFRPELIANAIKPKKKLLPSR